MKLRVGNSLSQVQGLSRGLDKKLKEALSYTLDPAQAHYMGGHRPRSVSLVDKRGNFPTGLLGRALEVLGTVEVVDTRVKPIAKSKKFTLSLPFTPYLQQSKAAEACATTHRGIISAVTGLGKSVIAAMIIDKTQANTLVVVPTLALKTQLTDSLSEFFGPVVGGLGSPIAVENIDGLKIDPKAYAKYDALIIDEFHRSAAKTYRKLNQKAWGGIYYRFGLTATPYRSQDHEQILLESILSEVIHEITYQEAVDMGAIVPVEAYYLDVPSVPMKGNGRSWQSVYSELVVRNDIRNGIITKLLNNLAAAGLSTLCLVKEIAHGEALNASTGLPFASGVGGGTKDLVEAFCRGSEGLIGTTGVLGTGVDTKPAEYIVLAAGGKSPIQFQQNIGRGLRRYPGKESCKVIMFRDATNRFLLRHFKEQVKVLKEIYGIVPERIELE